ncbi:hypothetical protein ACPV5R_18535 [Vibrio astriarenae]
MEEVLLEVSPETGISRAAYITGAIIQHTISKLSKAKQYRENLRLMLVLTADWEPESNTSTPSLPLLAVYLDVSVRTASRRVKELESTNVITVKRKAGKSNIITFDNSRLREYLIDAIAEEFKAGSEDDIAHECMVHAEQLKAIEINGLGRKM